MSHSETARSLDSITASLLNIKKVTELPEEDERSEEEECCK
jgi:hypothetical protein